MTLCWAFSAWRVGHSLQGLFSDIGWGSELHGVRHVGTPTHSFTSHHWICFVTLDFQRFRTLNHTRAHARTREYTRMNTRIHSQYMQQSYIPNLPSPKLHPKPHTYTRAQKYTHRHTQQVQASSDLTRTRQNTTYLRDPASLWDKISVRVCHYLCNSNG